MMSDCQEYDRLKSDFMAVRHARLMRVMKSEYGPIDSEQLWSEEFHLMFQLWEHRTSHHCQETDI